MVWLQERLRADCECPLYKVNAFPDLRGKIINIKKNKMKKMGAGQSEVSCSFLGRGRGERPLSMDCGRNWKGVVETSHRKEKCICIEL